MPEAAATATAASASATFITCRSGYPPSSAAMSRILVTRNLPFEALDRLRAEHDVDVWEPPETPPRRRLGAPRAAPARRAARARRERARTAHDADRAGRRGAARRRPRADGD